MYRIQEVIGELGQYEPFSKGDVINTLEHRAEQWSTRLMRASFTFGALLVLFLIIAAYYQLSGTGTKIILIVLVTLFLGLGLLAILSFSYPYLFHFARWRKEMFAETAQQIAHDEAFVNRLLNYTTQELTYARDWLRLRLEHAEKRLALMFGKNITGIALLGAVATLLGKWGIESQSLSGYFLGLLNLDWKLCVLTIVSAFVIVVLILIMARKAANMHYERLLALLEMALKIKAIDSDKR